MKFRYKVMICNLILLSVSLGIVGYLMIRRNFDLAMDARLENAFVENNLVQSSVEYSVLQIIYGGEYNLRGQLEEIGKQVRKGIPTATFSYYIQYGRDFVYSSDEEDPQVMKELYQELEMGRKNYVVVEEEGKHYIYVASSNSVDGNDLNIISKSDASEAYMLLGKQSAYFRTVLVVVLLAASLAVYLASRYLTAPLEQLTEVSDRIAEGDYSTRADIRTKDEVGFLAERFNRMADAVSEHVRQLQEMVHRRDRFVADFTHEIKTPMTSIIGYADTLRSMELPRQEQIMALNYIFLEGRRLEDMSGKLFDLIYLRRNRIEQKKIHVTDLVQEISRITVPLLEKNRIVLEADVEKGIIRGNKELLLTVYVNLIDNARKASGDGGRIRLEGRVPEDEAVYELSVVDYGIGMTPEETTRICDEFYMVDKSRSRREGGAGIGMSLVAIILDHHGAKLQIESAPGEGTCMKVRFFTPWDAELSADGNVRG